MSNTDNINSNNVTNFQYQGLGASMYLSKLFPNTPVEVFEKRNPINLGYDPHIQSHIVSYLTGPNPNPEWCYLSKTNPECCVWGAKTFP